MRDQVERIQKTIAESPKHQKYVIEQVEADGKNLLIWIEKLDVNWEDVAELECYIKDKIEKIRMKK